MAPKRKHGEGAVDSPVELARSRGDALRSTAEFAKPIYLVAEQAAEQENEQPAYSVIKVDAAAAIGGDGKLPRARTVAALHDTEHGMSFVAAHSAHGSWIVGVGGDHNGRCVIFNPATLETFLGPGILFPKHEPVVISHGGEVYAISRRPRVVPYLDFEPWFLSLSFNDGVPSVDSDSLASWKFLTPPPFFPCALDPYEFANPPKITVTSFAAVGSHVLISPQPELKVGTYGFHVVEKTWAKVSDENLPSAGEAVPIGGNLFAACPMSKSNNPLTAAASVFRMSLTTEEAPARLSIQEFVALVSEEKICRPLFCPLGKSSFCSIRLGLHSKKRVQIILTTIQTENVEAILTACQTEGDIQVEEQIWTYKCKGQFRLMDSAMPVVAALSMDTEDIQLFEGNTTKIRASQTADGIIFDAPVIPIST